MSMYEYLEQATNFDDMVVKPPKTQGHTDNLIECPVCKGYGGWNLRLNAYGAGKHFQAFCSQCWGWGWVVKGSKDSKCIHEMMELSQEECENKGIKHWGNCWHVTECKKCGEINSYDSSG